MTNLASVSLAQNHSCAKLAMVRTSARRAPPARTLAERIEPLRLRSVNPATPASKKPETPP